MRIVSETPARLELLHRPRKLLAPVGAALAGYGIYLLLYGADTWKVQVSGWVWIVFGLYVAALIPTSRVVIDKTAGAVVSTHYPLIGRPSASRLGLWEVSAVVISRDRMYQAMPLHVICVRARGADIPLTLFGSPFPPVVHRDAQHIADFLGLPLVERDRIIVPETG